jgi:glycolate oxidase FAD binding subunit
VSEYALHKLLPDRVVAPATPAELADCLREATAGQLGVVPWGGGTRQALGGAPTRYDIALLTGGLDRVLAYHPADLVVTVEAGITLSALQAELNSHGQWLPWDVPLPERATVGGLLASGVSGSLRLGFGTPRDWTLGMCVALGDGRLVHSGGRVVKNVAGYDTHKLQIGALGTLGVIVEATFKLAPLPAHRQTMLAAFVDPRLPARAIAQLCAAPLQPVAVVALNRWSEERVAPLSAFLDGQPNHIVVAARFTGVASAVHRQLREAARRCVEAGARTVELREEDDAPLWAALADSLAPMDDGTLLLRAGAPSGVFGQTAGILERTAMRLGLKAAQLGIVGGGIVYSRWPVAQAREADIAAAITAMRAELGALGGYLVVEQLPAALRASLDIWGPPPEGVSLMRALRSNWDPAGILNPGRYLV